MLPLLPRMSNSRPQPLVPRLPLMRALVIVVADAEREPSGNLYEGSAGEARATPT